MTAVVLVACGLTLGGWVATVALLAPRHGPSATTTAPEGAEPAWGSVAGAEGESA